MSNIPNPAVFIQWLKNEVKPALGCTEPIAIAYAASVAAENVGREILRIEGEISANLYKNAMGVTIPGTTLAGVDLAAGIGAYGGNPSLGLELLKNINERHINSAIILNKSKCINIKKINSTEFIFVDITVYGKNDNCRVVIEKTHTGISHLYLNGIEKKLEKKELQIQLVECTPTTFTLYDAFSFIQNIDYEKISFMAESAKLNQTLSEEGKRKKYGLNVNGAIRQSIKDGFLSDDLMNQIIIDVTAASDARMGGAPLAAMSNYGSGNQGITATMPILSLAKHLHSTKEEMVRALTLSHLIAISIHSRYTRLSALCAATTAAMGAAAGMSWLLSKDFNVISASIKNMISDISGIICDGASNSCTMKVSSAVMCAYKAVLMARLNTTVDTRDGIIDNGVEETINNLCELVNTAMTHTDLQIINVMSLKQQKKLEKLYK